MFHSWNSLLSLSPYPRHGRHRAARAAHCGVNRTTTRRARASALLVAEVTTWSCSSENANASSRENMWERWERLATACNCVWHGLFICGGAAQRGFSYQVRPFQQSVCVCALSFLEAMNTFFQPRHIIFSGTGPSFELGPMVLLLRHEA